MMSDMIERVARAIADEMAGDWSHIPERSAGETSREDLRVAARLAIEAMREPTELMLWDGKCSLDPLMPSHFELQDIRACWEAMIDAALPE